MEQYQAQCVSALRSSLGVQAAPAALPTPPPPPSALQQQQQVQLQVQRQASASGASPGGQHPLLQIAGSALATTFLESGLAAGE